MDKAYKKKLSNADLICVARPDHIIMHNELATAIDYV